MFWGCFVKLVRIEDLNNLLNKQIAISDWKLISQERINTFADSNNLSKIL